MKLNPTLCFVYFTFMFTVYMYSSFTKSHREIPVDNWTRANWTIPWKHCLSAITGECHTTAVTYSSTSTTKLYRNPIRDQKILSIGYVKRLLWDVFWAFHSTPILFPLHSPNWQYFCTVAALLSHSHPVLFLFKMMRVCSICFFLYAYSLNEFWLFSLSGALDATTKLQ